jgi:hypothetical protein
MALDLLGETLDIHCGGVDLIFPHHEDEIAQSEGATGKPFSRFWCHGAFLLTEGTKMAKRLGNVLTVQALREAGYRAAAIRHFVYTAHYRRELNVTDDALDASTAAVRRLGAGLCAGAAAWAAPVETGDWAAAGALGCAGGWAAPVRSAGWAATGAAGCAAVWVGATGWVGAAAGVGAATGVPDAAAWVGAGAWASGAAWVGAVVATACGVAAGLLTAVGVGVAGTGVATARLATGAGAPPNRPSLASTAATSNGKIPISGAAHHHHRRRKAARRRVRTACAWRESGG